MHVGICNMHVETRHLFLMLVAQATKPLNGPCGQGALLVAQAIATHMPCELWLHYCIEKYAPRTYVGRGGRHSESAQSVLLQCSAKLCS